MNKREIMKVLNNLPTVPLEDLKNAWITVVLKRENGSRAAAARALDIREGTIRNRFKSGAVKFVPSKSGRPTLKALTV
jgi:DNA-binding NtrC family response regulator